MSGQIVKLLREQHMSQKQLADLTGLTEATISHYVKGDRFPGGINLVRVAEAFGVTTNYLLGKGEENIDGDNFAAVRSLVLKYVRSMTDTEKLELIRILSRKY